jgi:hypothetical protein
MQLHTCRIAHGGISGLPVTGICAIEMVHVQVKNIVL